MRKVPATGLNMTTCPHLETCKLLRLTLSELPAVAAIYLELYCHGRSDVCARFVAMNELGRERVPNTLYPNQIDRAAKLIRAG